MQNFRGEDSDDGIYEHGRLHFQQDYITNFYFKKVNISLKRLKKVKFQNIRIEYYI